MTGCDPAALALDLIEENHDRGEIGADRQLAEDEQSAGGQRKIGPASLAAPALYLLIRHGFVSKIASYFFLVPPTTALIAWAMFGEHLGPVALAGMALAALGVALAQKD